VLFGFTRKFLRYAITILIVLVAGISAAMFLVMIDVGLVGEGEIRPVELIPIRTHESGIIESILVHDLQSVVKGDTMFTLNTEDSRSNLLQLEASLVSIDLQIKIRQHELLLAEVLLQRDIEIKKVEIEELQILNEHARSMWEIDNLDLVDKNRADPYDWKLAETRLAGSRIRLRLAEAETLSLHSISLDVEKLRAERTKILNLCYLESSRIAHATVLAPASGIIFAHELLLKTGIYVDAGTQLCELGNPDQWMVRCKVSDKTVPFIRSGQLVHIYIDALPYMVHGVAHGYVSDISAIPLHSSNGNEFHIDSVIADEQFQNILNGGYNLNGLRVTTKYIVDRRNIASCLWRTIRERGSKFEMAKRF
jgi:multidrug resistance efflux pump